MTGDPVRIPDRDAEIIRLRELGASYREIVRVVPGLSHPETPRPGLLAGQATSRIARAIAAGVVCDAFEPGRREIEPVAEGVDEPNGLSATT